MRAVLTLGGKKMHVKDSIKAFLDEYELYVCYGKITVMSLC